MVAVDQAVSFVYKEGIQIDLAIGDFDSLDDKSVLKNINTIYLDTDKNETDTEAAIQYAKKLKPTKIIVLGGVGGNRVEHTYANLLLLSKYSDIEIVTNESLIKMLKEGEHAITFNGYVNLFTMKEARVTLTGFRYNLDNFLIKSNDILGISNEVENEKGMILVHFGELLIILTKKDQ